MRTIEGTNQYERDYKREAKGRSASYVKKLVDDLGALVRVLAADEALEARHKDHALTGNWKDHRECHVRPDLLLIYRKPDDRTLQLVRLGSHSELGLK
jgi:mRNA interferase YafQ